MSGLISVSAVALLLGTSTTAASPRTRHSHRCKDPERVLGHRTCGRFGAWSYVTRLPPLSFGWLVHARTVPTSLSRLDASAALAREQAPVDATSMKVLGPGIRITVGVAPRLYLGGEMTGGLAIGAAQPGAYGSVAGVIGAQHHTTRTDFALELVAGAVFTDTTPLQSGWRADADVRIRVDRWITPWVTLGGFVGVEPFGRGYTAGALVALRVRAFDGVGR